MPENKSRYVKKYVKLLKKGSSNQKELDEADRKLSEDVHENEEGLGIDSEEEKGEEAYPEIELDMEHEDNPDKEDDE